MNKFLLPIINIGSLITHENQATIEFHPVATDINKAKTDKANDKIVCQVIFLLRLKEISFNTISFKFSARYGEKSSFSSSSRDICLYWTIRLS